MALKLNYSEYAAGALNKIRAARQEVSEFRALQRDPEAMSILAETVGLLDAALDKVAALQRDNAPAHIKN